MQANAFQDFGILSFAICLASPIKFPFESQISSSSSKNPEVIKSVLLENGLPVKEIFEGTQDQKIKDKLIKNTSEAVEKGVFGAPSLLVNNELFFGKETLQDVEELLVKELG